MSKALRSFPEHQRLRIAERRAAAKSNGLGKLAAADYLKQVAPAALEAVVEQAQDEADAKTLAEAQATATEFIPLEKAFQQAVIASTD